MTSGEIHDRLRSFGISGIDMNKSGWQKLLCPVCSKKRTNSSELCLSVNSDGYWRCHHCGWTGNVKKREENKARFTPLKPKFGKLRESALEWLTKKRGISRAVLDRNGIEESTVFVARAKAKKGVIAFPYFLGENIINVKYRTKEKDFVQAKGGFPLFYKINDILDEEMCIITEGELDALSFEEAGFKNAVSVPIGAPNPGDSLDKKFLFFDNSIPFIENIKRYYIAVDSDVNGRVLQRELVRRLKQKEVFIVSFPTDCKDANDTLLKHGVDALHQCIIEAKPVTTSGVYLLETSKKEFYDLYEQGYVGGAETGVFEFDSKLKFYTGQLIIVTGIPGHGKSNFMDYIATLLTLRYNWKIGLYNPENQEISIHAYRIAEILIGKPFNRNSNGEQMSREEVDSAFEYINNHFYYIFPDEMSKLDSIVEGIKYLVYRHGINMFILDPWNTIDHSFGKGDNESTYVAKALNKLKYLARDLDINLVVVAHPTKMERSRNGSGYTIPTLYNIAGSANFFNAADNGIVIFRNTDNTVDIHIEKVKHKFIGRTGKVRFNFDPTSQRYFTTDRDNSGNLLQSYGTI